MSFQGYAEHGVAPFGAQSWRPICALFGLGGHAMFTGMFGAFLGLAIQTRRRWLRILAPPRGLILAIAAHMLNNALPLFAALAGVTEEGAASHRKRTDLSRWAFLMPSRSAAWFSSPIFVPFLIIISLALWRSSMRERRVIGEELAGEAADVVSRREHGDILAGYTLRTLPVSPMQRRASAALVSAQRELGLRKRHVREEGRDPGTPPQPDGGRIFAAFARSFRRARPSPRGRKAVRRTPQVLGACAVGRSGRRSMIDYGAAKCLDLDGRQAGNAVDRNYTCQLRKFTKSIPPPPAIKLTGDATASGDL